MHGGVRGGGRPSIRLPEEHRMGLERDQPVMRAFPRSADDGALRLLSR